LLIFIISFLLNIHSTYTSHFPPLPTFVMMGKGVKCMGSPYEIHGQWQQD
jgi:hypothetical protein